MIQNALEEKGKDKAAADKWVFKREMRNREKQEKFHENPKNSEYN